MDLEELKTKIQEFDKTKNWDQTSFTQITQFLQEELDHLKHNEENSDRVNHLIVDILMFLMQLSYRYETNFDSEIKKWFEEEK